MFCVLTSQNRVKKESLLHLPPSLLVALLNAGAIQMVPGTKHTPRPLSGIGTDDGSVGFEWLKRPGVTKESAA